MSARIWHLLVIICIQISITTSHNLDRDALMALMHAWQDTPLNWHDGSNPCSDNWIGISCTNSRVTSIILSSTGLSGGLPGDIGQLTELQILNLSYNNLTGSLTTAIGNLKNLTTLVLVGCGFNGPIPNSIGNLERLRYLSLNTNSFTGSIPPTIGNLKSLYWLDLSQNNLTGSLPVSNGTTPGLDMLINTKHFHFGDNQLDGDIPFRLFNSKMTLIHLLFENNRLTGPIPSTLGLVKSLEIVRLDRNSLSGDVPSNFNNLINVTELYLSNNQLTGPVPNLTGMNSLNYVDLSYNGFEQTKIPSWFTTLQSLTTLKMRYTNLAGELPAALFSLSHLQNVDLSYNRIDGSLNISSNPSPPLELVDLTSNFIADFKQRRDYTIGLILKDNPICTESGVTDKFCFLPTNNTTPYSTPWNNCVPPLCSPDLTPSPNCQCAYPFTGLFSFKAPSFSSLTNATIYNSLHDLLMTFFMDAGLPVDSVSLKNPSRKAIDYLMLRLEVFPSGEPNFNRTGIIGVAFALSNQTFKPLKTGFNTYTFMAENYNNFLPGHFTGLSGPGGAKNKSSNTGIIIGSAAAGCVLVVLLVLAGMFALRQRGRAERATQQSQPFALWDPKSGHGGVPELKGARSFTFEELSRYTNNFSEINKIGAGGYGMVYKGSLPKGQLIAIKRAQQGSSQGGLEFKTEIELLSRVHHKNVVGLIGFCFDQGEQMLVYEYIVNGTLKDSLSEMAQNTDNTNTALNSAFKSFFDREKLTGSKNFNDWHRSLRIVCRVADRMKYLYEPCLGEPTGPEATQAQKDEWKFEYKRHNDVACLMLGTMESALQKQFEHYFPYNMLNELRTMFEKPAAVEIYDLTDALHSCRQGEGKPVSAHVLEMKGYMDQLKALGKTYEDDMAVNLINRSLNKDFNGFIRNFNMHCVGKTVTDLHALIIDYEKGLPQKVPTAQVLAIQGGRINKPKPQRANNKKGKGKGKVDKGKQVMAYQPQPKKNPTPRKDNPKKDQACHHCKTVGHWKRNCALYLDELRTNKMNAGSSGAGSSGV